MVFAMKLVLVPARFYGTGFDIEAVPDRMSYSSARILIAEMDFEYLNLV